jgi:hypothetical protein
VCGNEKEEEAIGVLCVWYEIERNGETLTGALTRSKMATHVFFSLFQIYCHNSFSHSKKRKWRFCSDVDSGDN